MEHTNIIIKGILRKEHFDYDANRVHYNEEYKLMQKAIDAQQLLSKVEAEPSLILENAITAHRMHEMDETLSSSITVPYGAAIEAINEALKITPKAT